MQCILGPWLSHGDSPKLAPLGSLAPGRGTVVERRTDRGAQESQLSCPLINPTTEPFSVPWNHGESWTGASVAAEKSNPQRWNWCGGRLWTSNGNVIRLRGLRASVEHDRLRLRKGRQPRQRNEDPSRAKGGKTAQCGDHLSVDHSWRQGDRAGDDSDRGQPLYLGRSPPAVLRATIAQEPIAPPPSPSNVAVRSHPLRARSP